jgi:hypothetical protein
MCLVKDRKIRYELVQKTKTKGDVVSAAEEEEEED